MTKLSILWSGCKENNIDIDWDMLERQSKYDEATWLDQPSEDWSCGFLDKDTNECKVYEARPSACRKYYVASDPKHCDPHYERDEKKVAVVHNLHIEVIASAMLNATDSGTMPVELLKQKHRYENASNDN